MIIKENKKKKKLSDKYLKMIFWYMKKKCKNK